MSFLCCLAAYLRQRNVQLRREAFGYYMETGLNVDAARRYAVQAADADQRSLTKQMKRAGITGTWKGTIT